MGKIVFIGNYKGGVGKTTTVVNFANYLSKEGHKVLTIDLDPQSSLSEIQISSFLSKTLAELEDDEVFEGTKPEQQKNESSSKPSSNKNEPTFDKSDKSEVNKSEDKNETILVNSYCVDWNGCICCN